MLGSPTPVPQQTPGRSRNDLRAFSSELCQRPVQGEEADLDGWHVTAVDQYAYANARLPTHCHEKEVSRRATRRPSQRAHIDRSQSRVCRVTAQLPYNAQCLLDLVY